MTESRLFKEPISDGESAFIKAATEPNNKLIDEQTLVILTKFKTIEKIVDEVRRLADLAVSYPPGKSDRVSRLKQDQTEFTDFLHALHVYSTDVVSNNSTLVKLLETFGNYAYHLKTLIEQIEEQGQFEKRDDYESDAKLAISNFEMRLSAIAANTKKDNATRALKEYNDTLHPQPPTQSKRRGGCSIL